MEQEVLAIPTGALMRQGEHACFRRLVNTSPVLLQVRSGMKVITTHKGSLRLEAGEFGLLPDYQPMTMEHIPDEVLGYQVVVLPLSRLVFEDAYARMGSITVPSVHAPIKAARLPEEALALFEFCCQPDALVKLPRAIAKVRLIELVTWFARGGAVLSQRQRVRLEDRLRKMIEQDPARDWSLEDVAAVFHMSQATLRRKLAAEQTGFSEVLGDTRMSHALRLLHTTTLPIAQVAQEVGYDSPSRFAARFKERFGVTPSHVRRDEGFERNGTEIKRYGANTLSR